MGADLFKEAILKREVPRDRRHREVWRHHGARGGEAMSFLTAREGRELNRVVAGSGGLSSQSFSEVY